MKRREYYSYECVAARERAERLIMNDVGINQTSLVEDAFLKGFFSSEDLEGGLRLTCNICGESPDYPHDFEEYDDCYRKICTGQLQYEGVEIFEWWCIPATSMKEDLQYLGEPILDNNYGTWWGRSSTGESLILDSVFYRLLELIDQRLHARPWERKRR